MQSGEFLFAKPRNARLKPITPITEGFIMIREEFTAFDGKKIAIAIWDEVENPKAVVQIVHGMAEHIARYDEFARYLNSRGYIVEGDDHRAHGLTDKDALGLAGNGDLFEKTVRDERDLTAMLKARYSLPVILFGHSYGSFLSQRYLSIDPRPLKAAVLCGSAFMTGAPVSFGHAIAKRKVKKHRDEKGEIFASLTFGGYDKKFGEGAGGWLNRDKAEVDKYNADPLCNFTCSNGFYYWFFRGLKAIKKAKHENLAPDFPLMIISGSDDMVGGRGKLVKKLNKRYQKLGLNPRFKLYEGGRHEIVNELNRAEVYADVADFFDSVMEKQSRAL